MNDITMLHEGLITTTEASNLFRYTSSYLAYLVRTNKINGHRLGRSWLIEQDSLLRFITQRGKQDLKNTYIHAHPRPQEHQTNHTSIMSVKQSVSPSLLRSGRTPTTPSSSVQPSTIAHHSVFDDSHIPSLSPKWIAAVFVGMFLIFGAMTVKSPMFSQSVDTLQMLSGSINRTSLALGEFVIAATHAVIAADTALAYGIAAAAPITAQMTIKIFISIGDNLSNVTARIPVQVASVFAHGVQ